jgi:hypothetical protein
MCCIFTILLFLGPRFAGIVWWIANPLRWVGDTNLSAFNSFIWPVLGLLLAPWTTLMYVIVFPGGVNGLDWLWIGLAVLADLSSYAGGGYGNRDRVPGF